MAIKNKFIHFKTRAAFNANIPNPALTADEGNTFYNYTTFIKDTKEIYTHGTFYKCDISAEEVEALVTSKGYITEDDIPVLSGGAAATSGQYVSGVTVSGHTVTVTKAALPSAATVAPKASGTAAVGTSTKYAREDHVHPSQTNVATATKLATPRVIAIAGAVSGSATFDGSTNISISTTLANIDASKITSGTLNADRLPTASSTVLGGVKIGSGISISSGVISATYTSVGAAAASHTHTASQVTGLATVATSGSYNDLTNKPSIPSLSGYATQSWVTSQGYLTSIPAATSSAYGGIQIGYTTSDKNKNYAVQLSNGKAYVHVPWTDTTYSAGTNISISGTTINCTYTLPTASSSVLGGVKVGSNITLSSGTISLSSGNVTSALGYTPANTSDIPEIPIALPNPYALTINGTSYTGSSEVSINTARILSKAFLGSSTVSAGYSYHNYSSRTISSLNGFSSSNPDSVIISTAKLTFTANNVIKMEGLADLDGAYYIYCLSYMASGHIAVNGAVYSV